MDEFPLWSPRSGTTTSTSTNESSPTPTPTPGDRPCVPSSSSSTPPVRPLRGRPDRCRRPDRRPVPRGRWAPPVHQRWLLERARRFHRAPPQPEVAASGEHPAVPQRRMEARVRRRSRVVECGHEALRDQGQPCRQSGAHLHHRRHLVPRTPRSDAVSGAAGRRSLALYYFSVEDDPVVRSTEYRARPGDGAHSIWIFADTQLLRAYDWSKRHLGISDQTASRLLAAHDRLRRKKPGDPR